MKKNIFITLLLLLSIFKITAEDVKLPRLAVVEFSINDPSNSKLVNDAVAVRNQVQSNFVKTGRYDVIARAEIDKLLENQQIAVSSISDKKNLQRLSMLQIAYLITGSVDSLDNKYVVTISMLDVATGQFIHSDETLMGNTATEIYQNTASLVTRFMNSLKSGGSEIISEPTRRNTASVGAIGIHVETGIAGVLYLQENNDWKELASLWDNDSYDIPIDRPAVYSIKIRYPDGAELTRKVNVNARGIFNILFTLPPENCKVVSVTGTTAKLSWTYEEGINHYSVKYYPTGNPNNYNTVHTGYGSLDSSITVTGLKVGTEYTFEIESMEDYSNSSGKSYPSKPTIIKGRTSSLKVDSISAEQVYYNRAAIKYEISDEASNANHIWYYSKNADFSTAQKLKSKNYTGDNIDELLGLSPNTSYFLWLVLSENNQEGKPSSRIKIQTTAYPYVPDEVFVEGGSFVMGASDGGNDEKPIHKVTVSSFRICKHEVTQADWQAIMGTNPSHYKGDNRPVGGVSWCDAVEFCNRLSENQGLVPCYKKDGNSYTCDFKANGYRLPTEAEWEYAARGGKKSNGCNYSGSNNIGSVAWCGYTSSTHEVMTKQPNELGVYDMSGNVWEWCWDWYDSYSSSDQTNPIGTSSGSSRVKRGGSWISMSSDCRVANRDDCSPNGTNDLLGFRVVRSSSN